LEAEGRFLLPSASAGGVSGELAAKENQAAFNFTEKEYRELIK